MKKPGRKPTPNGVRTNLTVPSKWKPEIKRIAKQMQKGTYKPNDNNA